MSSVKRPLYEVIFTSYRDKIKSGALEPGSKLPTEMEIAAEYSVSRITAIRSLKELELHGYIHRIKGSGSYVNKTQIYGRNSNNNSRGHLSLISLVVPFEADISFDIFKGIEDIAKEQDYFVTFHNSGEDSQEEKRIVEDIISRGSHGVIIYPTAVNNNMDLYSSLLIDKYPFVLIDHKVPGIETSLICADNQKGFNDITAHLFGLGHRRIIMVGTDIYRLSSELERYKGFCQAHLEFGVPLPAKHLYDFNDIKDIPPDYRAEEERERRGILHLLDSLEAIPGENRPTAIAAVNDTIAQMIITIAREQGISIPEDYSVTGFDNLPWAEHLPVPLTTAAQPVREIGRKAAEELFRNIREPDRTGTVHTVQSQLICRSSSAAPRSN